MTAHENDEQVQNELQQPFEFGIVPEGDTIEEEADLEYLEIPLESGWQKYAVGVGAWCALFPCAGILNTMGAFQSYLAIHQLNDYSQQQIGWIFSMYAFLLVFGGAQVGPLFDAYGLKWLLIPGYIGLVASLMAFSVSTEYYQFFLSFGVLGGLASSCVWTTSIATTGHWFFKRRGIATGIVTSAGPLGGIIFPVMFQQLEPRLGFGWTVRSIAFICLAMGGIAMCLMRTRIPSSHTIKWNANFKIFTDIRFMWTIGAMFSIEFACLIPSAYITTYALSKGVDSSLAYQQLAIMNAAQVPGRAIPGWLADRWGRFNVMILSSVPCAIVVLAVWLPADGAAAITAFSVLFGFLSGTANSLTPVCISQLCKTEDYGSKYGTAYLFLSPATLIGIPIAGAVLRSQGGLNFSGLILLCGLVYLTSAVLFTLARISGAGWKIKKVF